MTAEKYILYLANRPLITRGIQAAREIELLDKFIVSTEDSEIKRIVFERDLRGVIKHLRNLPDDRGKYQRRLDRNVQLLKEQGEQLQYIAGLRPASLVRMAGHIAYAFNLMEKNAIGAVSMC